VDFGREDEVFCEKYVSELRLGIVDFGRLKEASEVVAIAPEVLSYCSKKTSELRLGMVDLGLGGIDADERLGIVDVGRERAAAPPKGRSSGPRSVQGVQVEQEHTNRIATSEILNSGRSR
jgi:hypothetical protein